MAVILASGSPRRRELLAMLGVPYDVIPADIDETMDPEKPPRAEVARVSRLKAMAIAPPEKGDIVIAADTIVVCDGKVLGKPHTREHAREMLRSLSGRPHEVITGCTVRRGRRVKTFTEVTKLHFRPLSDEDIERYVLTDEPLDKAGAYAIQGGAALFCERIVGDYYNIVGLPLCHLQKVLQQMAPDVYG